MRWQYETDACFRSKAAPHGNTESDLHGPLDGDVLLKDITETTISGHLFAATLELIKAAVLAGELDAAIDAASSKVRAGFAK